MLAWSMIHENAFSESSSPCSAQIEFHTKTISTLP
jgi:hypothetical protein